ncbi:MAG: flagellar brake protein [Gammaproteobacteria bacterium]|nr:flagellar brake protein [Gammaproteobacteria bacterium]
MEDSNELLNLTMGTVLQVQATVPDNAPRYSVRLVGALPGASLVVTTPTVDGRVQIVREGQRFTVRALKGERVMGFVAQVIYAAMKPYPHLHLEYPSKVEQIVVRNASRVNAEIPVQVRNTDQASGENGFIDATMIDLSETGAKIASLRTLGQPGALLHLKFSLMISGVSEELGLLGDIKNVSERTEKGSEDKPVIYHTGLQFRTLSRFQQVLLHAWVTNRFLKEALSSRAS